MLGTFCSAASRRRLCAAAAMATCRRRVLPERGLLAILAYSGTELQHFVVERLHSSGVGAHLE